VATLKIFASLSLLIATTTFDLKQPVICDMAPERATTMYSLGLTTFPLWPTWSVTAAQPSSQAYNPGSVDENNDFPSLGNCGRRFLSIGNLCVGSTNYLLKVRLIWIK
jgi:hypothetical protein